jgi:hypothetical protein
MVSAQARLEQVRYAVQRGLSQRRACALMRAARSGLHYDLRMPVKDAPVIEAMKDLSGQFPRFGARRIHVFLERQGIEIGVGTGAAASGALPACAGAAQEEATQAPRTCSPTAHAAKGSQLGVVLRLRV